MKLCRYDNDRLGIVEGAEVLDVSEALDAIAPQRWPYRHGDALIASLPAVLERARQLSARAARRKLSEVRLRPPVANPSKIINAPINYQAHIDEAKKDQGIAHGREIKSIADWGLFLKSPSSLAGAGDGIALRFPERRNDHEVELAVVIGREANRVRRAEALDYVCGYSIGLDMTLRGPELPQVDRHVQRAGALARYPR